ncbi:glycosyltransferase family 9 protein [Methanococcus maripaludis]|uniref:ADP-heptose--LPS heptosyltransferase 2 n=1 Tax=Methanococcus maripaludis TaxID=39152 RepID=A0A2L1CCQ1_METMI|nr:glycosyltransferase family 9 protein [Methanococcus maripaludis]AVB77137.1 ADP-heptose--LPS heptosyltransferase 2 [Methanococcus maripaludis]MBA2863648.1 heptosyltransferase-2 [Methanococcus maripaludis]MBB6496346.1 heptosyltransferase-2 [Methanococcus maripaludis]
MNLIPFMRNIDKYFGNVIIYSLCLLKSKKQPHISKKHNILIIRLWTLGESILTLPLINAVKYSKNPCEKEITKITILTTKRSKSVFENVDFIDEIFELENFWEILKKFKEYDVVIDTEPYFNISAILGWFLGKNTIGFKGLGRDKLYDFKIKYDDKIHAVYNFCNLSGPFIDSDLPKKLIPLNYTIQDQKKVNILLKEYSLHDKPLIGIHCGTAETAPWRTWKKENFAKLIENLIEKGYYVVLTGSGSDNIINKEVLKLVNKKFKNKIYNFASKTNLREFSYLLTKFNVFISNDTGPMHLAAAMGTKTVGLFGPNLPERFAPFGKQNIALYNAENLKCSPCINVHEGKFEKCKLDGKCMDLIEVNDVLNSVTGDFNDPKLPEC